MAFEVFLIQHSHIDIGYTERQEKIADYQAQFIAQAVAFSESDKQNHRSPDAKFRFMCEGFWAVEQFFEKYGESGKARFVQAVKNGTLELSAFYLHLAELLDEDHLRDSIEYAAGFARHHGLPLTTGMASDINGMSWGMVDILADVGVKYLITNLNSHHGGCPLGSPLKPFYWESPRGQRVLVWSGLAYHKANLLGLMPGFCPTSDPGIPGMMPEEGDGCIDVKDTTFAAKRVFQMVEALESQNYPFDFIPIMGSGLYTDNSPVTDGHCELIAEWNRKFGDQIHIRTASLEEFFVHLESRVKDIPVYRGDWTDWWTDGVLSTPFEVKLFRNAQRTKRLVEMLDPHQQVVSAQTLDAITRKLVLYAEHTWGHSASHSQPWKFPVQQVDARKDKHAIDADILACSALDKVLATKGESDFVCRRPFRYQAINPQSTGGAFAVEIPVDFWEVDVFRKGFRVRDVKGNVYPSQQTTTLRGWTVVVVLELGAQESRELWLEPDSTSDGASTQRVGSSGVIETPWYRVEWGAQGFSKLTERATGQVISVGPENQLGAPVYQIFPGGNRTSAAGFGYSQRKKPDGEIHLGVVTSFSVVEQGPVYAVFRAEYTVPGAQAYRCFTTIYQNMPQIHFRTEMTKDVVLDPEGMYTAFPLLIADGRWYLDKPGALVLPGRDQLPGACCDYFSVNQGAVLSGPNGGAALALLDSPLVTIGALKLWDYTTRITPEGTLYAWLCNNKWETNFKAECGGLYESRYILEVSPSFANPEVGRQALKHNSYGALVVRG